MRIGAYVGALGCTRQRAAFPLEEKDARPSWTPKTACGDRQNAVRWGRGEAAQEDDAACVGECGLDPCRAHPVAGEEEVGVGVGWVRY